MNTELVKFLANSATLIAPSRRHASRLRQDVNAALAKTQRVWSTPHIFALEDWLHALWDQLEMTGAVGQLLLTQTQALLRIEEIISESDSGKGLLRQHLAAKTALEAWNNLHQWLIEDHIEQIPENIDQGAFQEWALTYREWLQENHYIDNAQLVSVLLPFLLETDNKALQSVSPSKCLILYGFEDLSPLYVRFFDTLMQDGWQIIHQEPHHVIPEKSGRVAFADQESECNAAAMWAKTLVEKGKENIAIVVPNLADMRSKMDSIFRESFDSCHILAPVLSVCGHFNISAATPLIQYPIVFEALSCLAFGKKSWPLTDYLTTLTCAFITASESECLARAQLGAYLKTQSSEKTTLQQAIKVIDGNQEIAVPKWRDILSNFKEYQSKMPLQQSYSNWANTFREILDLFGWPGVRPLNSVEYQIVMRFDELLNELMLCDCVLAPVNYYEALSTLQKIASNVPFQAENKGAPIQILGLLEAAGQTYDYLWVMGLHSEAWPPNPSPNPFISIELQRSLGMPHAGALREMEYAIKVTNRFKQSAKEIIFSYPLQDKEKELAVSELIRDVPLKTELMTQDLLKCEHLFQTVDLDVIHDDKAPSLEQNEDIRGSASLLEMQAACPFKAFASLRLKLRQPIEQGVWLQPHQQGTLLHRILEEFWQQEPTLEKVMALSDETLLQKLEILIDKHLQKIISLDAPAPYVAVEKNRLTVILLDYLALEKQRTPFTVIATEKKAQFSLAGIPFSIRLDRIDKTHEGDIVIMDYKTGQFKLSDIWGRRAKAPQLPLYFIASDDIKPNALVVTKLNGQACQFEGLSEDEVGISGLISLDAVKEADSPRQWTDLKPYWHEHLHAQALDFKEGQAQVSPLQGGLTCAYCHLSALCRINDGMHDDE